MTEDETWMLVDMHCLSHIAFHAMNGLQHEGEATAVAFGVFRELQNLTELFRPDRFVFAFDHTHDGGLRSLYDNNYKKNRRDKVKEMTDDEKLSRKLLHQQIKRMGTELLPECGYQNIFRKKGFEGDDILAEVALNKLPEGVLGVIVSSDNDMWQCLSSSVVCYSPHKKETMTIDKFRDEHGIEPQSWPAAKAYAGDTSDNVIGLPGVGIKTAVKYIKGELKDTTVKYKTIVDGNATYVHNMGLVMLPFPGLEIPDIVPDKTDDNKWNRVMEKLGISTGRRNARERPQRQRAFE